MNPLPIMTLNFRSKLKHITRFILGNGDHLALILSQIIVNEIYICYFFALAPHCRHVIPKAPGQKPYKCNILPFWTFTTRLEKELIYLFLGALRIGFLFRFFLSGFFNLLLRKIIFIIFLLFFFHILFFLALF